MPAPVIAEIALSARRHVWAAGTVLFQRGDPSESLIFIETGRVKISLMNAEDAPLSPPTETFETVLIQSSRSAVSDACASSAFRSRTYRVLDGLTDPQGSVQEKARGEVPRAFSSCSFA